MRLVVLTLLAVLALASPAAASQVTNVTLDNTTPSAAAGAKTTWRVGLTTTSALSGSLSQNIRVTFPQGTDLSTFSGGSIMRGAVSNGGCNSPIGLTITCPLNSSASIPAATALVVEFRAVTNASTPGAIAVSVTTTTDVDPASSTNNASVVTGGPVTAVTTDNSLPSAGAGARTLYVVDFNLSATGGLTGDAGSQIRLTLPAGSAFASGFNGTITNVTTGLNLGGCNAPVGQTVTCPLNSSATAAASQHLRVTLRSVVNGTTGTKQVGVSTTTDLPLVPSANFSVVDGNAVSAVSVNNTVPSAAAGARTTYLVDFTLSATGGLAGEANSQIQITLPTGTTFANNFNGTITDVTTATTLGGCNTPSLQTVTCPLNSSAVAGFGHQLRVALRAVVNPTATGTDKQVTVATTSDLPAVSSGTYAVVDPHSVSNVTAAIDNPSSGAGSRTRYVIRFTLSETGGLTGDANGQVTVNLPAGTTFGVNFNGSLVDLTTATSLGGCFAPSGQSVTCSLNSSASAAAGHQLELTLRGVINSTAGAGKVVKVSTTTDLPFVDSAGFTVDPGAAPSDVTVDPTNPSPAAGARTLYVVEFTASPSTGGLFGDAGSQIVLQLPSGTTFGSGFGGTINVGQTSLGGCNSPSGLVVTCPLNSSASAAAGARIRVTLRGVINGPAGPGRQVAVSTTSDVPSSSSPMFTIPAGQSVSNVAVVAPTTPATSGQHVVTFTASSTGGMYGDAGSAIDVTFPTGTTFPNFASSTVRLAGSSTVIGGCSSPSGLVVHCNLSTTGTVPPGGRVEVTFPRVTTPASAGPYTLRVSTTSDVPAVTSAAYAGGSATPPETTISPAAGPPFDFATDTGSTYECSIDDGAYTACASPYTPPALAPGEHVLRVRARDAAGNTDPSPAARSFTVAGPDPTPQAIPTAQPTPAPSATPTPTPIPNQTVVAGTSGGSVCVRRSASSACVPLGPGQSIPLGSIVDARKGTVEITASATDKAKFYDGIFKVTQKGGYTNLALVETLAPCPKKKGKAAAAKPKKRKLWGDGKGKFRTEGKYAAATVRGTKWLVQDSCAGTLTKVEVGVVEVQDNVRHKKFTVRAKKSYTAKPKR